MNNQQDKLAIVKQQSSAARKHIASPSTHRKQPWGVTLIRSQNADLQDSG